VAPVCFRRDMRLAQNCCVAPPRHQGHVEVARPPWRAGTPFASSRRWSVT
jgi:hypothetical protein